MNIIKIKLKHDRNVNSSKHIHYLNKSLFISDFNKVINCKFQLTRLSSDYSIVILDLFLSQGNKYDVTQRSTFSKQLFKIGKRTENTIKKSGDTRHD